MHTPSMFPSSETNDGVEFVSLLQRIAEEEREMYLLLNEDF